MNKIEQFVTLTQSQLFEMLLKEITGHKMGVPGKYLLVCGTAPVMLLAHMDTVHKDPVRVICRSADGNIIMSPQGIGGDDRCGVFALVKAYRESKVKPWLLFTCDEEIGGKGAAQFASDYEAGKLPKKMKNIKFLIEIDRKGSNDAVYYDCDNDEFEEYITRFGFKTDYGSYSDICDVAPAMGVAAVNLSSGYYQAHTQHEYINKKELNATIRRVKEIIEDACTKDVPQFEYIEREYVGRYSKWGYNYYYDQCKIDLPSAVPDYIPDEYVPFYTDLLDLYAPKEIKSMVKAFGPSVIMDLYEDAFGPFYETENDNIS